ncbi:hypothetical protein [Methylacidiphilum caldifontis]|uniref:Uncharacterized protein n=1 Tax=Methylacidiphilum caldifontis TaxID=2795386 RepID=A0A4Y8P8Z8_9BACT|nr:hypothetical protein [Methylacidiphilum caldifontis]TFE67124.1 hypothetical protein A7Q10_09900 [Methylacidiphilum caldifontis]
MSLSIDPQQFIQEGLLNNITHPAELEKILRKGLSPHFDFLQLREKWLLWMLRHYRDSLAACFEHALYERNPDVFGGKLSWYINLLWVFFWYEINRNSHTSDKRLCIEWLKGVSLSEEDLQQIGIKESSIEDPLLDEGSAKERIFDFCQLSLFSRPYVFLFDQTENYGENEKLAWKLAKVISSLVDYCPHQLTLVTANLRPWQEKIIVHWENAFRDRIFYPPLPELQLEGANEEQAHRLVKQHPISDEKKQEFFKNFNGSSRIEKR